MCAQRGTSKACSDTMRVALSGAATEIGYSLAYMIARGEVFGVKQQVILHLLDVQEKLGETEGLAMELADCTLPALKQVIPTADPTVAFIAVSCAFLISAKYNSDGNALASENYPIFKAHGMALNQFACKELKVLVIGPGANTNAMICSHFSATIPRENFSALTRLHQNRATNILADKLRLPPSAVSNTIMWGNTSPGVFPDAGNVAITTCSESCCIYDVIDDEIYLQAQFISEVQNRDMAVTEKRKRPPALSVAKAACDHMRDWWYGTPQGVIVSMGVISDGSYEVPKDLFFSFPVQVKAGHWRIVQNLPEDDFVKSKMETAIQEMVAEKATISAICKAEIESQKLARKSASAL